MYILQKYHHLHTEHKKVDNKNIHLQQHLQSEYNSLKSNINDLQHRSTHLQSKYNDLQTRLVNLTNTNNDLQVSNVRLKIENHNLRSPSQEKERCQYVWNNYQKANKTKTILKTFKA